MFSYAHHPKRNRPGSRAVLAIALLCGSALSAGLVASPAAAQKKKDKEAAAADYSKDFIAAYTVANGLFSAVPADITGATAAIPGVIAAIDTPDDRMVAGQFMVNVGQASSDNALTRQGLELMLESGKVPADRLTSFRVNAGGLAQEAGDFEAARSHFMAAHAAGHVKDDLPQIIAQTFFQEDRYEEGIGYLRGLVEAQIAANQQPNERWIDVAFSSAYNNDRAMDAITLAAMAVEYYPSEKNWRNAIGVQRNLITMSDDVTLDLMRLAARTNSLEGGRDFAEYIEAADARRLPGEVDTVLKQGLASGALKASDPFVADVSQTVKSRLAADKAELPALERDAMKPSATALTATAAGDVFLSYGNAAKAEMMYAAASSKAGADKDRVLTRMGIAQVDQGKFADADATFSKVGGQRAALAALWRAYIAPKMNGASGAAPMPDTAAAM